MSETETLEQEVEIVEPNAVEELISQITAGDLSNAEGSFKSIVQDKMNDALEAQRIATAQAVFNDADADVEDDSDITDEVIEDEEPTDEELDAVDTVMDEDEEILAELEDDGEDIDVEDTEQSE